jgi:hypothetical protein
MLRGNSRTGRYMVATRHLETTKGLAALNLLTPVYSGAGERSRTLDLLITNAAKLVFARIRLR